MNRSSTHLSREVMFIIMLHNEYEHKCVENRTSHFPLNQCVIPEYYCTCTWFTMRSHSNETFVLTNVYDMCKQQDSLVDTNDTNVGWEPQCTGLWEVQSNRFLSLRMSHFIGSWWCRTSSTSSRSQYVWQFVCQLSSRWYRIITNQALTGFRTSNCISS